MKPVIIAIILLFSNKMMIQSKIDIILLVFIAVITSSCDADYSQTKIPDRPTIDEDFYRLNLQAIKETIDKSPDNAAAYYKKARLLHGLQNYKSARINIDRAIDLDKSNPEYYTFLAENQLQNNEINEGINSALRAVNLDYDLPLLDHILAALYLKDNQLNKALSYNSRALAREKSWRNYFQRGEILLAREDTIQAIDQVKNSLILDKSNKQSITQLTKIYISMAARELHFADSAQVYLSQHLVLDSNNLKLWYDQGIIYHLKKNYLAAKEIYLSIIRADSLAARSMVKMSELHFDTYRNDSSLYYAEKALAIRRNLKEAILMQGKVFTRRKYFSAAREKFELILAMDSTYLPAQLELETLNRRINYFNRLEKEIQQNQQIIMLKPKEINPE